jgi:hypothetical protein
MHKLTLVTLLLIFQTACAKYPAPIESPDGRHVAIVSYALAGALGADYANVDVRAAGSLRGERVYHGPGTWDFKNDKPGTPVVLWLDSSRLLIRQVTATCLPRSGNVEIICEPSNDPLQNRR